MTIQLSVTVWTVLCFCLLMLILHHLLFKPVLRTIDARKERIARANAKKAALEKQAAENEAALREKEAAFKASQQRQIRDQIETIRRESRKAVETAREERLRAVDSFREKTEAERVEILETLSAHSAELAAAFAESVIGE